jgi:hypothetical protein
MAVVAGMLVFTANSAGAEVFSEAAKLGANTGAMQYCADHFADADQKNKYKMIRLKLIKEFDDLESGKKTKALVYRKAAEDKGEYLGDKLDKERCDSIRKLLYMD